MCNGAGHCFDLFIRQMVNFRVTHFRHAVCVEEFLLADWLKAGCTHSKFTQISLSIGQWHNGYLHIYLSIAERSRKWISAISTIPCSCTISAYLPFHHCLHTICLYTLNLCPTYWHERRLPRFHHLHMNLPSTTDLPNSIIRRISPAIIKYYQMMDESLLSFQYIPDSLHLHMNSSAFAASG